MSKNLYVSHRGCPECGARLWRRWVWQRGDPGYFALEPPCGRLLVDVASPTPGVFQHWQEATVDERPIDECIWCGLQVTS